jgi:hypothetical protein
VSDRAESWRHRFQQVTEKQESLIGSSSIIQYSVAILFITPLAVAAAVVRQLLKRWVLSEYTTTIRMDIQAKQKHSSSENKQNIATTVHIQSFFLSFFLYNSKEKFSLSDAARRRMSMHAHTRHS